jgi:crotonobetainyl-CoA:carnitine CoA-transferase CaiB-like acyl-CoA transferase
MTEQRTALEGLRVLDLSRVLAGPLAAQNLGDLGADVIKVERPGTGDDTRTWVPPVLRDAAGNATTESAYHACANRNKRSVTIDVSVADGQALVRRLAARSDVLIENYKAGALARYGLDHASLSRDNPRLVYCSITGFGQQGPYASRAGYDPIMQAMGGLMSVTGEADDLPGGGPQRAGISVSDLLTGAYATAAILAAIASRHATGRGQHIDMALFDNMVHAMSNVAMNYLVTGTLPARAGNAHPNVVPSGAFPASDGPVQLVAGNDGQFAKLCAACGDAAIARDPRFATNPDRVANRDACNAAVGRMTASRTRRELTDALADAGVPCGPINDLAQVFDDPHARARGLRIDMPHRVAGTVPLLASPLRLVDTPVAYRRPPPLLGEHTREVLRDVLGMTDVGIDALAQRGVI